MKKEERKKHCVYFVWNVEAYELVNINHVRKYKHKSIKIQEYFRVVRVREYMECLHLGEFYIKTDELS